MSRAVHCIVLKTLTLAEDDNVAAFLHEDPPLIR